MYYYESNFFEHHIARPGRRYASLTYKPNLLCQYRCLAACINIDIYYK